MHLVRFYLPLYDNAGAPFARTLFDAVRAELTETFGGVTAHVRSPAVGAWEDDGGDVCRDDVVLFEVVADELDRAWWRSYRARLEARFAQDEVMVLSSPVDAL